MILFHWNPKADELLAEARNLVNNRWKYRHFRLTQVLLVWFSFGCYWFVIWLVFLSQWGIVPFVTVSLLLLAATAAVSQKRNGHAVTVFEGLARYQDVRIVGVLLDGVTYLRVPIANQVALSLGRLLPLLPEEYGTGFTCAQREALHRFLFNNVGDLAPAALLALAEIGDGTSIPYLKSFVSGIGIPDSLAHRAVELQLSAQRALDRVQKRIDEHNSATLLLRASQIPGMRSDQLVRPVLAGAQLDETGLLRPVD